MQRGKEALIQKEVYNTVMRAVTGISPDVQALLKDALEREDNTTARSMLSAMLENVEVAKAKDKAVCQSPGYPTAYITFGDESPMRAVKAGLGSALADATQKGYLRPSIVDPLTRENSGDNSGKGVPNIEMEAVPGQPYVDFIVSFKGCGAELGNAMQIFTPAALGENLVGLKRFVLDTAIKAGGKPCPPYGIGIGIGGQMDVAARMSRRAISVRHWNDTNPDAQLAKLENELLEGVNSLGLGAAGTGGRTVALAVKIERAHTHTAIAPVAINFHCWMARRAGVRLFDDGRTEVLL